MGCMGRYVAKWYSPVQGRSINELHSVLVASLLHGPLIQPSPFPETSVVIRLDMFSGVPTEISSTGQEPQRPAIHGAAAKLVFLRYLLQL